MNTPNNQWSIMHNDREPITVNATPQEHDALCAIYGTNRTVFLPDLIHVNPTEQQENACSAAHSALNREDGITYEDDAYESLDS